MADLNVTEEKKQEGLSAREVALIRELTQERMQKNEKLEYESFDGYELPPRTQFSMLKKPAVSVKYGKLTFNMACIQLLFVRRWVATISFLVLNSCVSQKHSMIIYILPELLLELIWKMKDWLKQLIALIFS